VPATGTAHVLQFSDGSSARGEHGHPAAAAVTAAAAAPGQVQEPAQPLRLVLVPLKAELLQQLLLVQRERATGQRAPLLVRPPGAPGAVLKLGFMLWHDSLCVCRRGCCWRHPRFVRCLCSTAQAPQTT
jgi:hypothetical protein